MEKPNVGKSKSSNSAITTKSDNHSNKKSRSNAEFQRNVVKKRGVYVEKKSTNISIHNAGNLQNKASATVKAPPRPKPGQKRFLASVLTILSKSTAATQFPESETKSKNTRKKNDNVRPNLNNKPKKYRSKVLNYEMNKNLDEHKSLVLQYKNINNTPSNFSEIDSSKYRDHSSSNKTNCVKSDLVSVISSEAKGVVKQVLEGLNINKDVRIQEPVTQVEKIQTGKETGKNDEQLYKFFVDLLETTFSVYNVKADYDAAPNIESGLSSKVAFEIDESVVKKLETGKSFEEDDDTHTHTQNQSNFYYVKDTNATATRDIIHEKATKDVPLKVGRPRRLRTQSFIYNTKPIKKPFEARRSTYEPLISPKKSISRKTKKKNLMNLFREQLSMGYSDYEEPQTLFEALRVMARNKRKNEKAIRFDIPTTKECVFRQPKIISTKKYKKNNQYDFKYRPCETVKKSTSYFKPNMKCKAFEKESGHTLEVYGYDFERNDNNLKHSFSTEKEILLQHQLSDEDFNNFDTYESTEDQIDMFDDMRP